MNSLVIYIINVKYLCKYMEEKEKGHCTNEWKKNKKVNNDVKRNQLNKLK